MKRGRKVNVDLWRARTEELACLYHQLGTLDAVAQKVGLTRERVRQILSRGRRHGICKYDPRRALCDRLPKVPTALKRAKTMKELGQSLGYAQGANISHFIKKFGLPYKDIRRQLRANYKQDLIQRLHQHGLRLSTPELNTTVLESDIAARTAYNAWCRAFGGVHELRKELGIQVEVGKPGGRYAKGHRVYLIQPPLLERVKKFLTRFA